LTNTWDWYDNNNNNENTSKVKFVAKWSACLNVLQHNLLRWAIRMVANLNERVQCDKVRSFKIVETYIHDGRLSSDFNSFRILICFWLSRSGRSGQRSMDSNLKQWNNLYTLKNNSKKSLYMSNLDHRNSKYKKINF
jgi:hypothetical protein